MLMRSAHDDYIRDVIGVSLLDGGNQKKCLSFVRRKITENMGIPILSDTGGLHIISLAKADAINNQFASLFTRDNGTDLFDKDHPPTA